MGKGRRWRRKFKIQNSKSKLQNSEKFQTASCKKRAGFNSKVRLAWTDSTLTADGEVLTAHRHTGGRGI
jgi:hypothetical protein